MKKIIFISLFCLSGLIAFSQDDDRKLIQFSGLVLTADSNSPIPFSTIRIINTYWGTISNIEGFFSLVVREKDTIEFSSLGFKRRRMVIPEGIEHDGFSVLIAMN
ncbi:MAG: hypothetical protein HN691_06065, partial [Bacteroidetes bacterium]|nr:hypothetical protein [Bacteroidota bacterium]